MMPRTLWFLSFIALLISAASAEAQQNVFPPAADSQFPIEVRRAAWEFALTSSPNATAEEIVGIYQRVLSSLLPPTAVHARSGQVEGEEPLEQDIPAAFEDDAILDKIEKDPTFLKNIERMEAEVPGAIIGGERVEELSFPEVVFVRSVPIGSSYCVCTGTLISPDVVLTAEHCLKDCREDRRHQDLEVQEIRIGSTSNSGEIFKVKEEIPHPEADLAILILDRPVPGNVARPVRLASQQEVHAAAYARIIGYGLTETGQQGVKMIGTTVFFRTQCEGGEYGCGKNEMIALGGESDTCVGDSGGPILIPVENQLLLAGITSKAITPSRRIRINNKLYACGDGGVYTSVPPYFEFIKKAIVEHGALLPEQLADAEGGGGGENGATSMTPEIHAALEQLKAGIEKLETALSP